MADTRPKKMPIGHKTNRHRIRIFAVIDSSLHHADAEPENTPTEGQGTIPVGYRFERLTIQDERSHE